MDFLIFGNTKVPVFIGENGEYKSCYCHLTRRKQIDIKRHFYLVEFFDQSNCLIRISNAKGSY
jgi:hypothetical protein